MENETLQNPDNGQENKPDPKPLRYGRAYTLSALLSWCIFLTLLSTVAHLRQSLFSAAVTEPSFRAAVGEAAYICGIVGLLGIVAIVAGNGIISLFLPRTLKNAVSYDLLIDWVGFSNEKKILNLMRLHELRVYAAGMKNGDEVENLACRLVPLYLLAIHDKQIRWAMTPFQKIYFDRDELEELFDENIEVLRSARPAKLIEQGSLDKDKDADLKILALRKENYKGVKGQLQSEYLKNDYCRLHAFTIVKLVMKFQEKWPDWKGKSGEKLITHDSIQIMTGDVLAEYPDLGKKLTSLGVKGNPWLPDAMKSFFRHAMPDEMVDWRLGKPTLEHLIGKSLKAGKGQVTEEQEAESSAVKSAG